jgi:hypothetical protein
LIDLATSPEPHVRTLKQVGAETIILPPELTLIDIILTREGSEALQPWAMGQCLEGHPAFP